MKSEIENAIKAIAAKAKGAAQPDEAMNFAQAALTLAHAYVTMEATRRENEAKK